MAKDLPYFKFFCSEWTDGDITLEDYKVQGVFINICAYYWSNECKVNYSKLIKKFKDCLDTIDILENAGILKVEAGDCFRINFLDEQVIERKIRSKINSGNGAKGGRPKKQVKSENKPNALISLSESKGNKKRKEEIRRDKIIHTPAPTKVDEFDFDGLLKFINETFSRQFKVINKTVRAKFKARLKEGYTKESVLNAITNCKNNDYHIENDYKYCTPNYFSRSNTLDLHSEFKEIIVKPKFNPYG